MDIYTLYGYDHRFIVLARTWIPTDTLKHGGRDTLLLDKCLSDGEICVHRLARISAVTVSARRLPSQVLIEVDESDETIDSEAAIPKSNSTTRSAAMFYDYFTRNDMPAARIQHVVRRRSGIL